MSEPAHGGAHSEGDVFGLDNIRLDLPYAGAGARVMAGVIDYAIFYALAFAAALVVTLAVALAGGFGLESLGGWVVAIAFLLFFVFESFFFALQEILWHGQTLGKRALGLRSIAAQGHPASTLSLVLRNLVRSIDLLLGAWFLIFDRRSRRLGDRLAATVVVHETGTSGEAAVTRVPVGWGPSEIAVAEELLDRIYSMEPDQARRLSSLVLDHIEQDTPDFLRDVPADLAPTVRLAAALSDPGAPVAGDRGQAT